MTISAASIVRRSLSGLAARDRQRSIPASGGLADRRRPARRPPGRPARPASADPHSRSISSALVGRRPRRARPARGGGAGAGRAPRDDASTRSIAGRGPPRRRTPRRSSSSAIARSAASAERALSASERAANCSSRIRWSSRIPDRSRRRRDSSVAVRTVAVDEQADRQTEAEQAEPVEELLADLLAERVQVGVAEPIDRPEECVRRSSSQAGDLAQPGDLLLAQRRAGLGDEAGDRHDPRRELADPPVGARSGRRPRAPSRARRAGPRRSRRPATGRRSR